MGKRARRPNLRLSRTAVLYATVAVIAIGAIAAVALANRVPKAAVTINPNAKLAPGKTAPEFSVTTNAGSFDLATVSSPVLLEIFATWCPHCRHEIPVIAALAKQYAGRVAFVGVTGSPFGIDGSSPENQADVNAWAEQLGVSYPVAFDQSLSVANAYMQGGFPTVVVIGKNKKVFYIEQGEVDENDLSAALDGVLAASP